LFFLPLLSSLCLLGFSLLRSSLSLSLCLVIQWAMRTHHLSPRALKLLHHHHLLLFPSLLVLSPLCLVVSSTYSSIA
jgi:hypothetical protein